MAESDGRIDSICVGEWWSRVVCVAWPDERQALAEEMKEPMKPATIVFELTEGKCVARFNMDGQSERALAVELDGLTQDVVGGLKSITQLSKKDHDNIQMLMQAAIVTYEHFNECIGEGCPVCKLDRPELSHNDVEPKPKTDAEMVEWCGYAHAQIAAMSQEEVIALEDDIQQRRSFKGANGLPMLPMTLAEWRNIPQWMKDQGHM